MAYKPFYIAAPVLAAIALYQMVFGQDFVAIVMESPTSAISAFIGVTCLVLVAISPWIYDWWRWGGKKREWREKK